MTERRGGPGGGGADRGGDFERRLDALREEAREEGTVRGRGVRAAGGPMPVGSDGPPAAGERGRSVAADRSGAREARRPGYYGMPVLKPPVWTWEIPVYFFLGGLAGMAAVIGAAALVLGGRPELVRAALWTAAGGTPLCAALLVADLGRPRRFLHMLRVFKWRSPMSMGAWLLTAFGAAVLPAAILAQWSGADGTGAWRVLLFAAAVPAGLLGSGLATYTGVLIGATAIPAWQTHRRLLPVHFGVAGLGSAAAFLVLVGFGDPALVALGVLAAAAETAVGAAVELRRHGPADRALRTGRAGLLLRLSGLASGPGALALWLTGAHAWAAALFLAGALGSRVGWLLAGRASGRDPEAAFAVAGR